MNKILLRIGGAISLLFVLFHPGMVKPMGEAQGQSVNAQPAL